MAHWKIAIVLHLHSSVGPLYSTLTSWRAMKSSSHTTVVDKLPSSGDQEIKLPGRSSRPYRIRYYHSAFLALTEPHSTHRHGSCLIVLHHPLSVYHLLQRERYRQRETNCRTRERYLVFLTAPLPISRSWSPSVMKDGPLFAVKRQETSCYWFLFCPNYTSITISVADHFVFGPVCVLFPSQLRSRRTNKECGFVHCQYWRTLCVSSVHQWICTHICLEINSYPMTYEI